MSELYFLETTSEMLETPKSQVYIQIDGKGLVIRCEGGCSMANITNIEDWILIDEGVGDKYNLCQSHYFKCGLYTMDGIPLYKWDGETVQPRTQAELEADRAAIPEPPPSTQEQLRADVDFIAAMTGVSL